MSISKRTLEQMKSSSWIRRMFEQGLEMKRRYGEKNVFDISLGNPLLEPPPLFNEELRALADSNKPSLHRYMPNSGFPAVRRELAEELAEENGLPFSENEIIMTTGSAGAINIFLRAILEQDDEVVVLAPYFPEYIFYISHQGGKIRTAKHNGDYMPSIDSLAKALSPKTKAIIVNSPNNPTGTVYSQATLTDVVEVVKDAEERWGTEIYIVSDEAYKRIKYTDKPCPSIFKFHIRTVAAVSYSKDLGLAGERIGYLAINPNDPDKIRLFDASTFAIRTLGFVNAPAMAQLLVARLRKVSVDIQIYKCKRDFLYNALLDAGYECILPEGAFYMFPSSPIADDTAFINEFLLPKRTLAVPGAGFGSPGNFRISYCVEDWVLEGGAKALADAMKETRKLGRANSS